MNQNMYNTPQMESPKKKNTGLIIGIIIGGILLFIILTVFSVYVFFSQMEKVKTTVENSIKEEFNRDYNYNYNYDNDYDFDYDDDYDYGTQESLEDDWIDIDGDGIGELEYSAGVEGLNAEYYYEIIDYIRHDLSYSVDFLSYTDDTGRVECYYPYLSGEKAFISNLNLFFYAIATETKAVADEYNCSGQSVAYVTYMDEELFSVVFIDSYIFADGSNYEDILCYNIDMTVGDIMDIVITDISDEFLNELEKRCIEQGTSDAAYLFEKYTNNELREILTQQDYALVKFFTPLGMELGLAYEGYWCCSTFKDYEKYISFIDNSINL